MLTISVLFDNSFPEFLNISSIAPYDGDVYKSLVAQIWKRKQNFGGSPNWDLIRQMRIQNSKK